MAPQLCLFINIAVLLLKSVVQYPSHCPDEG